MSTVHEKDFPFNELRMPDGDYYDNPTQMMHAGFKKSQMWSIVEADSDDVAIQIDVVMNRSVDQVFSSIV